MMFDLVEVVCYSGILFCLGAIFGITLRTLHTCSARRKRRKRA